MAFLDNLMGEISEGEMTLLQAVCFIITHIKWINYGKIWPKINTLYLFVCLFVCMKFLSRLS